MDYDNGVPVAKEVYQENAKSMSYAGKAAATRKAESQPNKLLAQVVEKGVNVDMESLIKMQEELIIDG